MATIVNNPAPPPTQPAQNENGMGFLMGVILLIIFIVLVVYYGVPLLRRSASTPQITVPDKIDVNVNTPAK